MYSASTAFIFNRSALMDQGRSMMQYMKLNNSIFHTFLSQYHHIEEKTSCYSICLPDDSHRTMKNTTTTHHITQLLHSWSNGDSGAFDELSPLVYQELRRIAHQCFNRERSGSTLQPTALVNDVLLRLMGANVSWHDRKHFYTVAGRTMRRILVDHARSRLRKKRGGGVAVVTLDETKIATPADDFDLLALDEALKALEQLDQRKHSIIELHYFAGLTIKQTAKALSISTKTVQREMRFTEAWLNHALSTTQYDA